MDLLSLFLVLLSLGCATFSKFNSLKASAAQILPGLSAPLDAPWGEEEGQPHLVFLGGPEQWSVFHGALGTGS